jgi:uncharacterized protein YodC (DUF2158 family)
MSAEEAAGNLERARFEVGDTVALRSGGPPMTVTFVCERGPDSDQRWEADCVWFTKGDEVRLGRFRFSSLKRVDPDEP